MIFRMILIALALAAGAGNALAVPAQPKVGDNWTYQATDGYNGKPTAAYRTEVTAVTDSAIATRVSNLADQSVSNQRFTRNWNPLSAEWAALRVYEFTPAYPEFPERMEPGENWIETVMSSDPATVTKMKMRVIGKVLGRERVKVPAGEFDCIKIGRDTILDDAQFWRGPTRVWETEWFSPELNRSVRYETRSSWREEGGRNSMRRGDWTIFEMTAYKVN